MTKHVPNPEPRKLPNYLLAEEDTAFLKRPELRPVRLQLELLKPDMLLEEHNIASTPAQNQGWGRLSQITLRGGGKLGIYQPRHARPAPMRVGKAAKRPAKRTVKRSVRKTA